MGRQWWNRDTGYGLCVKCIPFCERGETPESFQRLYGERGVHYAVELEWQPLWAAMKENYDVGNDAWVPTTREMYTEMLNVLPPACQRGDSFLVGEPKTHDAENQPVFAAFRKRGNATEARYMTIRQFKAM